MDSDERMIALKKAYADIILNTSKEAAARVVVSERKAFRLEKELSEFKGQALQMLIRSKRMMDCKVLEVETINFNQQKKIQELNGQLREAADTICKAEIASLSQNKKIEELEAQLNEAEDIVKDLREELKEAHTEIEKVRKIKLQSNETIVIATKEAKEDIENLNFGTPNLLSPISEENILKTSQRVISSLFPVAHKKNPSIANVNERKTVIPSILLKSKGLEVCGNRRTQRIRAFEEKLMAGELSFTDITHNADANYERTVKEGAGEANDTCRVDKKVAKVSARGRKWRKFGRCKTNLLSTKDLYDKLSKIEDTNDPLSEEEPSKHEKVCVNDEEFIKNGNIESTMEKETASKDVEKVDIPAVTIETETPGTANRTDIQPVTFKYTFQRKRKKESLSCSEGYPPTEEDVSKKSTAERPNCSLEMDKCGSAIESSRDSRRLALVAHQLISLSEKKW